jgi:hypothetical protein
MTFKMWGELEGVENRKEGICVGGFVAADGRWGKERGRLEVETARTSAVTRYARGSWLGMLVRKTGTGRCTRKGNVALGYRVQGEDVIEGPYWEIDGSGEKRSGQTLTSAPGREGMMKQWKRLVTSGSKPRGESMGDSK